jgi:ankyrin repeat protein
MSELAPILNLLEVRVQATGGLIPSSKNRRQIENIATVLHGKKSSSGSRSGSKSGSLSYSPSASSPRNFFMRSSTSTQNKDSLLDAFGSGGGNLLPDESIREFVIDSNPNRIFITGGTVWEQVANPSANTNDNTNITGPRTSSSGRFLYIKKNILIFNDVILVCHSIEDDDIINADNSVSGSGSGSTTRMSGGGNRDRSGSKASSSGHGQGQGRPSPATAADILGTPNILPGNGTNVNSVDRDGNGNSFVDGTEFGNIDLDDIDELKILYKKKKLILEKVIYIKTIKIFDMPPITADISIYLQSQYNDGSGTGVYGHTSPLFDNRPTSPIYDSSVGTEHAFHGNSVGRGGPSPTPYNQNNKIRKYHRFELLFHLPMQERGITRHNKSIVLCSQNRNIADKYREEIRKTMIAYHIQFASPCIMNPSYNRNDNNNINNNNRNSSSVPVPGSAENSNTSPYTAGMGNPIPIQSQLRLGWMYNICGGTIFEAAYSGDIRALRVHLDFMSTYNGNFYSGGAGAATHALSSANLNLTSVPVIPTPKSSGRGNRNRSATGDSISSASGLHSHIHSGIGGTNLVINNNYYIDSLDSYGMTALHWACLHGHTVCARLLLDFGADMNVRQQRGGNTALIIAAASGNADIVSLLLHQTNKNKHMNLNASGSSTRLEIRNYAGHNAVEMALFCSHMRLRKALHNAKLNSEGNNSNSNSNGNSNSNSNSNSNYIRNSSGERGGSYFSSNTDSEKEVLVMKEKNRLQIILSALYANGANFNEEDAAGNTPLYLCVYYNLKYGIEILMELLSQGSGSMSGSNGSGSGTLNFNNNKPRGNTTNVLDESNANQRINNNGINFNAIHPQHRCTALQLACSRVLNVFDVEYEELHLGTVEIIRLLISGGAYVNWKNKHVHKHEGKQSSSSSSSKNNNTSRSSNYNDNDAASTDSGNNNTNSRRNSRDSILSGTDRTGQTYQSSMIQEEYGDCDGNSDDEKESYHYGRQSDIGSDYGGGGSVKSYNSKKSNQQSDSKNKLLKKRGNAGSTIGAWTPLQILQRTFIQVKLEEIAVINDTNMYTHGGQAQTQTGKNQGQQRQIPVPDLDFSLGSAVCLTPNPTFYGSQNHPASGRSSPYDIRMGTPRSQGNSNSVLDNSGGRASAFSSPKDINDLDLNSSASGSGSGSGLYTPQVNDEFSPPGTGNSDSNSNSNGKSPNPTDKVKKLSNVVFQAILLLLRCGARWSEKNLIECIKGLQPPKPPSLSIALTVGGMPGPAGGYGSDRGYGSGSGSGNGNDRGSTSKSATATSTKSSSSSSSSRSNNHHKLLMKPSLKYSIDECLDDWLNKLEPPNFDEFVCSRQAMGDVLYQLKKNWQNDNDQNHCELCVSSFSTITNRRHHCRCCGVLVCDKCSSKRLSLAVLPPSSSSISGNDVNIGVTKERTCDSCFNQLCQQVNNSQSANNRYCVKQLKASAEILIDRLKHFIVSLKNHSDPNQNQNQNQSRGNNNSSRGRRGASGSPTRRSRNSNSRQNSFGDDPAYDDDGDIEGEGIRNARNHNHNGNGTDTPPRSNGGSNKKLFTPPKQVTTGGVSRAHTSNVNGNGTGPSSPLLQARESGYKAPKSSSASASMFFCPGGSGYVNRNEDGTIIPTPSSPVRLSLIENDVGLYKSLQHRHLIKQQVNCLLECDFLAQTFLDASRMYQVEAEAHT